MKPIAAAGAGLATIALIVYTIAFIFECRRKKADIAVTLLFSAGFGIDLTATLLMIMGSTKGMLTLHGALGYSALGMMCAQTVLLWVWRLKKGTAPALPRTLDLLTRAAWGWWLIVYIAGGLLVALRINPVLF